jgi:hypothetical protein
VRAPPPRVRVLDPLSLEVDGTGERRACLELICARSVAFGSKR